MEVNTPLLTGVNRGTEIRQEREGRSMGRVTRNVLCVSTDGERASPIIAWSVGSLVKYLVGLKLDRPNHFGANLGRLFHIYTRLVSTSRYSQNLEWTS